ncbi:hypothetical protein DY000_02049522 [Brassica cretica]|uniref:Uncharacterized protein n=1 Tax=Brassica cretica TaxID=69181 RepID=A0ABQ7F4Y9_BRACR|nr:hypothetical protein DY000_02049522 [Brassica cretica]
MAVKNFGPHHKTILEAKHIEKIYELWGVDYAVEIELPEDGETPETVRLGYCGAYASHFEDDGLSFPLPRFFLEALAELKMEEGLEFGLRELKQLFAIKRNSGFPGTMILAPRSGRVIIEGITNRDDRWTEKFFVFKINPASVGDFDFERIPREWSDDIGKKEKEVLLDCPDESSEAGSLERAQKVQRGPVLRSRLQAQSPGLLARPVSIAIPAGGTLKAPDNSASSSGDRAFNDEVDSLTHRRRPRVLEEINSVTSGSSSPIISLPLRVSGEATSQVNPGVRLSSVPEASSWSFSYDNEIPILENPDSLPAIWSKIIAEVMRPKSAAMSQRGA